MYSPHPPCCQVPFCKRIGEDSAFCISCSKIGTEWGEKNRAPIMLIAAAFSFVGMILSLVCLIGLSTDADIIMNTSWNAGETDGGANFYVAPNAVIVEFGGETYKEEWGDSSCNQTIFIDSNSDTCQSCSDAALGVVFTVVVSFLTSITTLQTDIQRSTRAGDLNCQKFMGIFTAVAGFFSTLFSLSTYLDGCSRELPDKTDYGDEIDWVMGPGFVCLLVATLIKPIDFFVHMIVPVVKPDPKEEEDEKMNAGAL